MLKKFTITRTCTGIAIAVFFVKPPCLSIHFAFSFQADSELDAASWIVAIETAIQIGLGDRTVRCVHQLQTSTKKTKKWPICNSTVLIPNAPLVKMQG